MSAVEEPTGLPDYLPGDLDLVREPAPEHELRLLVAPGGFERASRVLHALGARFVTLLLADTPDPSLLGVLALRGDLIVLRAASVAGGPPRVGVSRSWWSVTVCRHLSRPLPAGG
jgi:hypothetical protein